MEFKLPGQLRGPECKVVMREAIAVRRSLEPWFDRQHSDSFSKLTIILRVDGSLGSFGPPGVENINLSKGEIECDLVIADHDWGNLSREQVSSVIRKQVVGAIHHCFETFDFKYDRSQLEKALSRT